jgi:hypothetical protein
LERDITVLPSRNCLSSSNTNPGCCNTCSLSQVASSTGRPLHLIKHSLMTLLLLSQGGRKPCVPIVDSFRPSRDPARALPLSHLSSDSNGGILQINSSSYSRGSHSGQTFGVACRCSRVDPDKPFRPISSFDETIVSSHIAADFDGGIFWGAFSVPGGAQTFVTNIAIISRYWRYYRQNKPR